MKEIQRPFPLPSARDVAAPKGFTYCQICQGYQHPNRHDRLWVIDQKKLGPDGYRDALATYTKAPSNS